MSSEVIEIFDEHGNLVGTQPRKVVHAQGHFAPCPSTALIVTT